MAADVRKPPRPPFEGQRGCSLCGTWPLPGRRRSWCSDWCVDLWMMATSQQRAYHHLVGLHGHACWGCGAEYRPGVPNDLLGEIRSEWAWANPGRRGTWGVHCAAFPVYGPPRPHRLQLFVDHVRPLWSLDAVERTELRWWLPFNLQLLCDRCHAGKTRYEAGVRAALRAGRPIPAPPDEQGILFELVAG